MDFEKKYPITQQPGDFITVQWTRGYKLVDLYYKDQLIGSIQGAGKLRSGTTITHTLLGTIGLKLSEKPIMLDLIIDGYHSPVNVSHPMKEMKKMSAFFWIIAVFSFIAGAIEVGIARDARFLALIMLAINTSILAVYIIAAIFVGKGKTWAYYLGFSLFGFFTIISLLVLVNGFVIGWIMYLFQVFRLVAFGVLIYNLKTVISAGKHKRYHSSSNMDDLLDGKI